MKKIALMAFAAVMLISCSDDDASITNNENENGNENEIEATLPGTWKLTKFTLVTAVDYNTDGIASNDLLAEASCLQDQEIEFNEDGTMIYKQIALTFNGNTNTFLGCSSPDIMPGTYTVTGNEIAVDGHSTETYDSIATTLTKSGNKLKKSWTGNMAGSYEYTKQE